MCLLVISNFRDVLSIPDVPTFLVWGKGVLVIGGEKVAVDMILFGRMIRREDILFSTSLSGSSRVSASKLPGILSFLLSVSGLCEATELSPLD